MKMSGFISYMPRALEEARAAAECGEVPVGAVVVGLRGEVLSRAGNETRALNDPTAHAEILAIRRACAELKTERLIGCSIWVTLEPCPMCAAAIGFARFNALYFGAPDAKSGGVDHGPQVFNTASVHHQPDIYRGMEEQECSALLRDFFLKKRLTPKD